jgi:hypothetical protein
VLLLFLEVALLSSGAEAQITVQKIVWAEARTHLLIRLRSHISKSRCGAPRFEGTY